MWYFGYYGSFFVFATALYFSPNKSLDDYTKEEAQKRMAARGETFGWPFPPDYCVLKDHQKNIE